MQRPTLQLFEMGLLFLPLPHPYCAQHLLLRPCLLLQEVHLQSPGLLLSVCLQVKFKPRLLLYHFPSDWGQLSPFRFTLQAGPG